MYPVYNQFVDSCATHQVNQMHSMSTPHYHHHPGQYHQSWPHPGYDCPGFSSYPGYFEAAPRPPYVPAPPLFYGGYPAPPVGYPSCYNCPPQYAMEVPHYNRHPVPGEMSGYYGHCCGCPNHQPDHKRRDGNNVKIEEERADDSVDSFDSKNRPSPVVWIPPGSVKNAAGFHPNDSNAAAKANERSKSSEEQENFLKRLLPLIMDSSGYANQGNDSLRKQEHQDKDKRRLVNGWLPLIADSFRSANQGNDSLGKQEQEEPDKRRFVNGWLPLIMDNPRLAKQGSDSSRKQEEHQDDDERQSPFPLIWMPYNLDDSVEKKDKEKTDLGEENPRFAAPGADSVNNVPQVKEVINHDDLKTLEKNSVQKVVPVKSVESTEKKKLENAEEKIKDSAKSKPSSPPRSSKLPPICLRVDPPHKKKNGKGSSRSSSPPGDKGKLRESSRDDVQPPVKSNAKEAADREMTPGKCVQESSKDARQRERKVKTIEVSEGTRKDETKNHDLALESHIVPVERERSKSGEASPDAASESNYDQAAMVGRSSVDESPANMAKEKVRRNLSEDDAATIIQSAYRGYEVRRWESLKKLKQIADVHNEVVKLSNLISSDIQNDEKWRVATEETIMNLLLKLDTIQGLHPIIRDVRKSVARELVRLQEKIDSLTRKKAENAHEPDSGSHLEISNPVRDDKDEAAISQHPVTQSEGETTTGTSELGSEIEAENASTGLVNTDNDQGHSGGFQLSQVRDDVDSSAGASEPLAESSGASSVETNEAGLQSGNEETNGDQGHPTEFPIAQVGDDEDTVDSSVGPEPEAESLEASSTDKNELGLQSKDKATAASDNLAMDGVQDHEFLHAQEMVEISDPKEVSQAELPEGDSSNLQKSDHLHLESGNVESPEDGMVMENDSKEKDMTQRQQEVLDDGDGDLNKDAYVLKNDEGSMDSDAKLSNDEVLDTDQQKEAQEVTVTITTPDSSEMNRETVGPHEVPMEAPEENTNFITKLGDESEVHDEVSTEMEEAARVADSEAQSPCEKESVLSDAKSCEDQTALILESVSPASTELAAKDDKLMAQPCDSAALEEDSVCQIELDGKDTEGEVPPLLSPAPSESSLRNDSSTEFSRKLVEENEKLREMMQKLIEAGNQQLATISDLSGRVQDLEKKLWRKNRLKMRGSSAARNASRKSCVKP